MVAKNGTKLKRVQDDDRTSTSVGKGKVTARRISMSEFATRLSGLLDRPVRDTAQKKRWAEFHAQHGGVKSKPTASKKRGGKRRLSAEGRANIVAALKKRWAAKKAASGA